MLVPLIQHGIKTSLWITETLTSLVYLRLCDVTSKSSLYPVIKIPAKSTSVLGKARSVNVNKFRFEWVDLLSASGPPCSFGILSPSKRRCVDSVFWAVSKPACPTCDFYCRSSLTVLIGEAEDIQSMKFFVFKVDSVGRPEKAPCSRLDVKHLYKLATFQATGRISGRRKNTSRKNAVFFLI